VSGGGGGGAEGEEEGEGGREEGWGVGGGRGGMLGVWLSWEQTKGPLGSHHQSDC